MEHSHVDGRICASFQISKLQLHLLLPEKNINHVFAKHSTVFSFTDFNLLNLSTMANLNFRNAGIMLFRKNVPCLRKTSRHSSK